MNNDPERAIPVETCASEGVHSVPYTQVSNAFVRDEKLPPETRLLLIYLISFPPNWRFHDSLIQKEIGVGREKLEQMFRQLRAAGYVKTVRVKDAQGKIVGARRIFSRSPEFVGENHHTGNPCYGQTITRETRVMDPLNKKNDFVFKKNTKKDFSDTPPGSGDEDFENFWKLYPREMRKGRQGAKKAFEKATRTLTPIFLLKALESQILEKLALSQAGLWAENFPWPQKWLNQGYFDHKVLTQEEIHDRQRKSASTRFKKPTSARETTAALYRKFEERAAEEEHQSDD